MAIVAGIMVFTISCEEDDKSLNIFTIQDDIDLGNQIAAEIENDPVAYPILSETTYPDAYTRLNKIMNDILGTGLVAFDDDFPWESKIIHNDTVVNAFATPGGHLYFYTGLIKSLDNEAMFAGVMAHEMAHCARRHSTDQLTKAYGLSVLLAIILGDDASALAQIAADIGSGLATLAFSRNDEYEADEYAVKYMYQTAYHAPALGDFFTKLEGMPQPPIFLSTHPSPEDRIQKINEVWQSLGGANGQYFDTEYQQFKNMLP